MTALSIKTHVSPQELLRAVEQLSLPELTEFVSHVATLEQRKRQAFALTPTEQAALNQILQKVPASDRKRYKCLVSKRRAETLTEAEYTELIQLSEKLEEVEVNRLEYLNTLAQQRGCKLTELLQLLHLTTPSYE